MHSSDDRRIAPPRRPPAIALALLWVAALTAALSAQTSDPKALYTEALEREAALRQELASLPSAESPETLLARIRTLVGAYQDMANLFPASGFSDNALWQGGVLAEDAYWKFRERVDRSLALRLLTALTTRFPSSSLVRQVPSHLKRLEQADTSLASEARRVPAPAPPAPPSASQRPSAPPPARPAAAGTGRSVLKAIHREVLPDALRFTLELEREVSFDDERLDGPPRVFVDLRNTTTVEELKDETLPFRDDIVKQARIGRQADGRTRVVLDLTRPARHSVYALYNPYRIVIDLERPLPGAPDRPAPAAPPAAPTTNAGGGFSLSRQLGLGIARITIDPGHGGHDPGARIRGLTEADLVLDVALRLQRLLEDQGVEVVLTRRDDTFLSLEERTAIANKSGADLFLSIHANANNVQGVSGVETYFLDFAQTKEAEAVAARENAASEKSMHQLPDIVRAIALDNKIDESRDFARMVQASLYDRLRKANGDVKNLGVKQAPFVVLIGATMPSILSEIAFMTNHQEAALLKTERYRQAIAEALQAGIMKYQDSLKKVVATQ
jgi:N-acetylmuramoyl-L-alanine amidase